VSFDSLRRKSPTDGRPEHTVEQQQQEIDSETIYFGTIGNEKSIWIDWICDGDKIVLKEPIELSDG